MILSLFIYFVTYAALLQIWYWQKLRTFWGKVFWAQNFDGRGNFGVSTIFLNPD